jgi:hypothetical protein
MKILSAMALVATLPLCLVAGAPRPFPSQITTSDGTVYRDTAKLKVYPDGILVSYRPEPYGFGVAKLKFRDLPEDMQKQYGYDARAAAEFEKQTAEAAEQYRTNLTTADSLSRYRQLVELHRLIGGAEAASYSVSLDGSGKVTAQAFTGTQPSMIVTNVGTPGPMMPPYGMMPPPGMVPPYGNMAAPGYAPQQAP